MAAPCQVAPNPSTYVLCEEVALEHAQSPPQPRLHTHEAQNSGLCNAVGFRDAIRILAALAVLCSESAVCECVCGGGGGWAWGLLFAILLHAVSWAARQAARPAGG